MSEPIVYSFSERLVFSNGVIQNARVENVLLQEIPGAKSIEKAGIADDRSGTDWWVTRSCGRPLSVDAKVRQVDYSARGQDDLALETWSVVERSKPGWTRDETKKTDYILWLWTDTGRWCLVPFVMLCGVMRRKWEQWRKFFKVSKQRTPLADGGCYHSECVFVPRREVWKEIYTTYSGNPMPEQQRVATETPRGELLAMTETMAKAQQWLF